MRKSTKAQTTGSHEDLACRDPWPLPDSICWLFHLFAGCRWVSMNGDCALSWFKFPLFHRFLSDVSDPLCFLGLSCFAFYPFHAKSPKEFWILLHEISRPYNIVPTLLDSSCIYTTALHCSKVLTSGGYL